jgi:hypothetical protein
VFFLKATSQTPGPLADIHTLLQYAYRRVQFQLMSKDEIKYEINRVLDGLSNDALHELLSFLKQLEEKHPLYKLDADKFNSILEEDEELLKKLAQ